MSADREFYEKGVPEHSIGRALDEIRSYCDAWAKERRRWFSRRRGIRILELGAGTCTISTLLSKEPWAGEIIAGDISLPRMEKMQPFTQERFGGEPGKIHFAEVDFNEPLPFPDGHFDLVAMDASLHHSRSIWFTVAEIHRVLKPHGHFVAQREQFVAPLTAGIKLRSLLLTEEVASGVSENAYLKEQYDYYLRANGFAPKFRPALPSAKFKALWFLNGLAFSKYNIIAYRANGEARPLL